MLGKKLINAGPVSSGANTFASENFNTVLYTGNGSTQRIGGYINRGAEFNGSSSKIDLPTSTPFDDSDTIKCISGWVKLDTTTSRAILYSVSSTTSNLYYFYFGILGDLNKIYVAVRDGSSSNQNNRNVDITPNTDWNHIVAQLNGSTVEVWLNGVQQTVNDSISGTATSSSWISYPSYATSAKATIGITRQVSPSYSAGKKDQIRFFNKALSSSEIATLYGETHASSTISTTDIFDDNSGVALYQLDGNANDTGGASGKFGGGAIFNGSSSKIVNSNFASLTQVGISMWVNIADVTSNYTLIARYGTNREFAIYNYQTTNGFIANLYYNGNNGNAITLTAGDYLTNNTWHHIAYTADGSTQPKLYIDGVQRGTAQSNNNTYYTTTESLEIGGSVGVNRYLNGKIDDVRIYSDALSSTEVGYLYNNTTTSIPTDNLVAYYKLDGDARDEQQLYDGTATNVIYAYDGTATNVTYQEATKFQPDLVWIKRRNSTGNPEIYDSVRGEHKVLQTDGTTTEYDYSTTGVTDFDSNGFSVAGSAGNHNVSGGTFVAWCWKAGGTAVSNTDGSITSSVSANQDAGFSIVEYTGTGANGTVGHGLSSAPELIITKYTNSGSYGWYVYDAINTATNFMRLNTTAASSAYQYLYNNTEPTSTVFTIDTYNGNNTSGGVYINYCFHSVEGYSKVGSYTGTGVAGNMVETGFEPAFVMLKLTSAIDGQWVMYDNKRSPLNPRTKKLAANSNVAENDAGLLGGDTVHQVNFLSNGFELLQTGTSVNTNKSGETYIYLAIAADPDTTTPTVENSFDVVTYTGDGTTDHQINVDFKPDLVWIGGRTTANYLPIMDSVRGNESIMFSSLTGAASTYGSSWWNSYGRVKSFNSDGFILDYGSGSTSSNFNQNGQTYVAWCWKAGDHDDNLPQINTEGSIDSVVSVNAEAGFSIVKYSGTGSVGATVGHGLSSAPELYIIKEITAADDWMVVAKIGSSYQRGKLNTTDAFSTAMSGVTNSVDPTSTVITLGNSGSVNQSGQDYIGYFFHSVSGYQKIGTYAGNGGTRNIALDFKPRWIMIKAYNGPLGWYIFDSTRHGSDTDIDKFLRADVNNAEGTTSSDITFETNNVKIVSSSNALNGSAYDYIYLAIK